MRRTTILLINVVAGMGLLGAALTSEARQLKTIAPTPIPGPIITAKTLFVANGGGENYTEYGDPFSGEPERPYRQFYAAMKQWGRFRLVTSPSDADLVIEIRLTAPIIPAISGPHADYQLRAVVIGPKTHIAMWAVAMHIEDANRQISRDQNFDRAMGYIVSQIQGLAGQP
jgi:hypothetical protein